MAYTIITKHRDGTQSTEYKSFPVCPPSGNVSARTRKRQIEEHLKTVTQQARDCKGWNKRRTSRMVASIPPEVFAHVRRNEGREAATDIRYLIRKAQDLGLPVKVSKGRF